MEIPVLVSLMSVVTIVGIYFWWVRKPAAEPQGAHAKHEPMP
jgi:hypothetical protein